MVLPQSDGMKLLQWDRADLVAEGAPEELFGNITVC